MKALLIDDERLARNELRRLLKAHPEIEIIGEAVDVTGWLGGYNFQWAWASAVACARSL